ncbi:MAG TPA: hypothetical protein DEO32_03975 [Ruminococcaceae bacterium]|nr:hypothetical protein [Oscillospiraceae bacterium]
MHNRPRTLKKQQGPYLLWTFLTALGVAALLFVPFIIFNGGIFYYFGDFNVQEIPFYQMIHGEIQNGNTGWNHLTDLGSDTISSYSFYILGSPFFWMTLPFPNEFVPYLIGPLLILKFACAASAAYLFLKRYVRRLGFAMLGGLLYAFSGFSIYNVFFFHFHEPMIAFPLLLAALDAFIYDDRRGVLAIAVFAACVTNYYFFTGQALFVLMYFLIITFSKTYKFKFGKFLLLAAEVAIGFCASAFMLLPSVLGILGNPRLDSFPRDWDSLVFDKPQRYWLAILSFLFPADIPAMPVFTPDSDCKWASVAGWLPMFGVTGMIAFLQLKKRDWLKRVITLLMLFALVPVLNSMFQMMNSSIYYARWFYILVLMICLATVRAIEDYEANWSRAVAWTTGLTAGAALLIGIIPSTTGYDNDSPTLAMGVAAATDRFWQYVLVAMAGILTFVLVYKKFYGNKRRFFIASTVGTLIVAYVASFMIIGTGVLVSSTTEPIKNDIINKRGDIKIDDLEEVRSDFYECVDNTSMYWKVQSMNCFQSSVSPSIMQFYKAMGVTRDVASRPDFSDYGLRGLFSCKYYFDYNKDNGDRKDDCCFTYENGNTKMPFWKYLKTCNNFDIYENECYIPMGFVYDSFVTEEEFKRVSENDRTQIILNTMVLSRETMKKYADITGYDEKIYSVLYGEHPNRFKSDVEDYIYSATFDNYKKRCNSLAANSCKTFRYTKDGFEAFYENKNKEENIMFFSVPYSEGFTAEVNGRTADVEKVNYGFCGVKIPADSEVKIVFRYKTPGLDAGITISLFSLSAYLLYMGAILLFRFVSARKQYKRNGESV